MSSAIAIQSPSREPQPAHREITGPLSRWCLTSCRCRTRALLALLRPGRVLEPRYRELAILRTGIVGDSKFEYSQHLKVARMAGIPEEKLQAVKGWQTSDKFDATERAVMAAADELVGRNLIEDATFAELKRHFSDEQIMELVYVIAMWRMHGIIVRALHLEYDNDTTARMREVPAPSPND
ncbi:MAG: carboxymuconolactone decarboxylase family protein [Candidatus Binataceae bacterium]